MTLLQQKVSDDKRSCELIFGDELAIYNILALKEELDQIKDNYQTYTFDLGSVEEIDTAGVQLLLAFKKILDTQEKRLRIIAISKPVEELLTLYQLEKSWLVAAEIH